MCWRRNSGLEPQPLGSTSRTNLIPSSHLKMRSRCYFSNMIVEPVRVISAECSEILVFSNFDVKFCAFPGPVCTFLFKNTYLYVLKQFEHQIFGACFFPILSEAHLLSSA